MANWFQPYLIRRSSLDELKDNAEGNVDRIVELLDRQFGGNCSEYRAPSRRDAVTSLLTVNNAAIVRDHWPAYVEAMVGICCYLNEAGDQELDRPLRYSELPGDIWPPPRIMPGINLPLDRWGFYFVSYLCLDELPSLIRDANANLASLVSRGEENWRHGVQTYIHWLSTAKLRQLDLVISFS